MLASHRTLLALLFAASGFAGLVYEVLWLRDLGLLFGNTAQAASTTLAAFFLGLTTGGWFWARRSAALERPLRTYALLELAIALSAAPFFLLVPLFEWLYEPLYSAVGESPAAFTAVKFLLAATVLAPPAFFMGGTLPVMGQHLVRRATDLGRTGAWLYAINTVGAAAGAFCAGFYLPQALGFTASYVLAMTVNFLVAAIAYRTDAAQPKRPVGDPARPKKAAKRGAKPVTPPWALAFFSGLLAIGVQVLWTRMFSQVMQNSVYTFSAILVVFLAVLALGGFLASALARRTRSAGATLLVLLTVAGLGVAVSPFLFMDATDGMRYIGSGLPWRAYVTAVFVRVTLVIFVPGVLLGAVFPYLMKAAEGAGSAGAILGRLTALNTLGAAVGSVAAGFVVLPTIGLWGGLRLFGLGYLVIAMWSAVRLAQASQRWILAPAVALLLLFTAFDATQLPILRIVDKDERLLETWEGSHGTVAVVERPAGLRIKVNNFYRLGGSAAAEHEQNQALIPLMNHPNPKEVFFLGMGTGITAGAALRLPVENVVVCELVPEVISAGARYFNQFANGLFTDRRVSILAADGRNHLAGSNKKYDAVLGDLFIPWKQGSGSLYSLEHFQAVSRRLKPGGVFMQWLPLYQVSEEEFLIIARTMLEVFPEVVVWRGDFYAERPILGLMASNESLQLDPDVLVAHGRLMAGRPELAASSVEAVTLPFYAGNLGRSRGVLADGPVNTDDRPVIEHRSPVSHRSARSKESEWFTGSSLVAFYTRLVAATPVGEDPYLARLDEAQRGYVQAGRLYFEGAVAKNAGDDALAAARLKAFYELIPLAFQPETDSGESGSRVEE